MILIDFTPALPRSRKRDRIEISSRTVFTPPTASKLEGPLGTLNHRHGFRRHELAWRLLRSGDTHRVHLCVQARALSRLALSPRPKMFPISRTSQALPGRKSRFFAGPAKMPARILQSPEKAGEPILPMNIDGLPLMKPPYGTISAINLDTGEILWQIAHGETPDVVRNSPAL